MVRKAITTVEGKIFEKHPQSCLRQSLKGNPNLGEKAQKSMSVLKKDSEKTPLFSL